MCLGMGLVLGGRVGVVTLTLWSLGRIMPNGHYDDSERLVSVEQNQKLLIKKVDKLASKFDMHVKRSVTQDDFERINEDFVVLRSDVDVLKQWMWKAVGAISILLVLLDNIAPLFL